MNKYLVEASRKMGLFEPYEPRKYYLMSKETLAKMLSQSVSWAVWSAHWVNLELTPLRQLKKSIEKLKKWTGAAYLPFLACLDVIFRIDWVIDIINQLVISNQITTNNGNIIQLHDY